MDQEKVKTSAYVVQLFSTLTISYLTTLTGYAFSWPSYTVSNFASNETVLERPMTSMEISLMGSLPNIGAVLATPFTGYLLDKIGRKYTALLFGLPYILVWSTLSLTTSVPLVITACCFGGIGAAGLACCTVYIGEICQDSIRGSLSSFVVSAYFVGLLISYFLGGWLSYQGVLFALLALSTLYLVLLIFLKDSPVFLMQIGKEEEAAKSIAFYRNVDVKSKEVEIEISKIKMQLHPNIYKIVDGNDLNTNEHLMKEKEKEQLSKEKTSSWAFLKKSKSSRRALALVLILMISNTFMGPIVLQVYAEPLFMEAVPSMSSNLCSIFLAVVWILACNTCSVLVDRFGRRFLMISTSVAAGVCTLVLGIQLQIHFAPHWFTAVVIYAFCFVTYAGCTTVPFILPAEVFLPEVRGLGNSLTMLSLWLSNFLCLVTFTPLVETIGLGPLFYVFTVVCFGTAVYSQFYLPETKGLSADAIQLLFLENQRVDGARKADKN